MRIHPPVTNILLRSGSVTRLVAGSQLALRLCWIITSLRKSLLSRLLDAKLLKDASSSRVCEECEGSSEGGASETIVGVGSA